MSKLPKKYQFVDLSDYGRSIAKVIAKILLNTKVSPIHITGSFIIAGLIGVFAILNNWPLIALIFLILKSILDAADGTLARMRGTPSHVGRYFDSISDLILNFIILHAIWYVSETSIIIFIGAFISIQLQGTLYNYYYAIVKQQRNGDTTSRVFENSAPLALSGEKQLTVNRFFKVYKFLYGIFDYIIYKIDRKAVMSSNFPNWYLTALSIYGLGFQLLIIGILFMLGFNNYILPFFCFYSILLPVFVGTRYVLNRKEIA